jgi:ABC-type Mn2+/Zn2+ transport system permease subunit
VIESFVDSWELFHLTWLTGWLIAVLLAMVGTVVVARDQIFLGAAVAQTSTFGVALALWLAGLGAVGDAVWVHEEAFPAASAVAFSILAALVAGRGGGRRESAEAVSGWLFLASASGSILVVARSPHALEEVHRLVASSIIGATFDDVLVFAGLGAGTAAFLGLFRRPLLFATLDPTTASALGLNVRLWTVATSLWLGLAVGLAIRASGMLYTFGALVLPALAARSHCREMWRMLLLAPALGLAGSLAGFVLANDRDLPPAQVAVAVWCLFLLAAWIFRALRRR